MANLTGLTQRETVLELPRSATRPMGTRRGAKGRTVIDYKDDTIEITRPVPETVFRTTDFDLTKEVASIKRGVDRRHAKDLVQATHEMNRRRPRRSVADPSCYDPQPTAESVAAIEKRLGQLRVRSEKGIPKRGSRVTIMNLPDDVVSCGAGANDFRIRHLENDIGKQIKVLDSGGYKTLGKGRRQPVPVGIMVDENQNDVILYDEYPQWYRMSEYNENFFARHPETVKTMGMGKNERAVHPRPPDHDFRMSMVKHQIAMGERKG
mmetsp:Transcript_27230/g.68677  ORF Transcript_27230/g.68677 Transcript_27230/m.68677 type:complete len:265 (-) Transcript_27230:1502-2296(-)|eukprot:CAMPEP_0179005902 /NCGR_PEP_ID=MMETSP0795-20121207/14228_1 /TAXON_ID=88552 /ORGANISM="Amoebophrya sp., Strain Ameob2" /LENGTH=264 /DNA_ID=CAMNT_0020700547 /DNA_START=654 /DNA_END=1448 /DNA_ORIENTATION=-